MPSCIVQGCTSSSKTKDPAPVLHAFPPEIDCVKTWLLQTEQDFGNLEDLSKKISEAPRGSYRMCSLHFGKECYEIRGRSYFLKKGAVPTVFPQRRAPGDVIEVGAYKPLKRSKRSVSVTLTESAMTTKEHSYAGAVQTPVHHGSDHNQEIINIINNEPTMEVEIMPDSPPKFPLEDNSPRFARRKKVKLSPLPKPMGKVTEYNSRQVHRGTNTDPYFGKSHKKISVNINPKHFSIGIQCNLLNLPTLQDSITQSLTMPSIDTVGLSNRIRKMVLHRGRVFVMLV
ncbi:uncharacterized protein LOC130267517 [Hyla sarda]|uniref:uncharacterized protein LOC130267517 n=1 Tax=Hyla sarda TaxID=327740 RepID=UPI0024C243B4|nr:uncharacterized protein LOC130267517 [Hyla sarda]